MSSTPPSTRSRYATTSDGISIAYVRTGDGYPVVYLAGFGHVVREWNIPEQRAWYAGIAAERSLVRLDIRNFGLSERNAPRITVETCIADVEAVVEHLGLERFDLMAVGGWTPAAIGFAASHQKSVSKLVLWSAGATIADWHGPGDAAESPHDRVDALLEAEPEIQLGLLRLGMFAGSTVPPGEQREYIRAMATPEGLALYNRYLREADVRDAVARVQCPHS